MLSARSSIDQDNVWVWIPVSTGMTIKPIHREIQRSHTKEYIDGNGNVSHRNKKGLTMIG
jgi:hypothetical protein